MANDKENVNMDKIQEIKEYLNQNQMRKVLFGGYSKDDVQMKLNNVQTMLDAYEKEQAEKEAYMIADFEKKIKDIKEAFETQKRASEMLIIDLNKNIVELTEYSESVEKEQYKLKAENDALTAENQQIIQGQYKMKESYKAYCGEILKKYFDSLNVIFGELTSMVENVSTMQKIINEENIIEGVERALEMLGDNEEQE
jgi:FtsZ-binding cell division protein ZapB